MIGRIFYIFLSSLCRNSALSGAIFAAVFEKPQVLTIKNNCIMKATEIFNQSIVAHNPSIDDTLDPKVIENLCAHNDRLSYDYERLYNSGQLLRLLKSPKKAIPADIVCRDRKDEESHPGLLLMKGADFILPLRI